MWAQEEQIEEAEEDYEWDDPVRSLDDPLTAWTHREAALHVAAGRFEHALCLVERYRKPISAAEKADRNRLPPPEIV